MLAKRMLSMAVVVAVCSLLTFMPFATEGRAQCNPITCGALVPPAGDLDLDGVVTAVDLGLLIDYLFAPAHPPFAAPLCNAEINGTCNRWFPCEPTIGDLSHLIDMLFTIPPPAPVNCNAALPMATGPFRLRRGGPMVPGGATGNVTFWVQMRNRTGPTRRLYGYSLPLRVFGWGVTINSVTVVSQFTNGGAWGLAGSVNYPPNRVFVYAPPDVGLTPTAPLAAGATLNLVQLTVNYTNTTPGPRRIRVRPYVSPPAEVPVLSVDGGIKTQVELFEEEILFEAEEIPTTSDTGRALLVALLVLIGLVIAARAWRLRTQS